MSETSQKSGKKQYQYLNGLRITKPHHREIARRFEAFVDRNNLRQRETEEIFNFIEKCLDDLEEVDDSKLEQFKEILFENKEVSTGGASNQNLDEKSLGIFKKRPKTIVDYINLSIQDDEEKTECLREIYSGWKQFQFNLFRISFPHYAKYLIDSNRLTSERQFQELNQKIVKGSNDEIRASLVSEFFLKQYVREMYFFLKSGMIFSDIDKGKMDFDKLSDFLPSLADMSNSALLEPRFLSIKGILVKSGEGEILMDEKTLAKMVLMFRSPFDLGERKETGIHPLSQFLNFYHWVTNYHPVFSQENKEKIKDIYYSLVTHKIFPLKNLPSAIILKILPGMRKIFDFENLFNHLWEKQEIMKFLEEVCVSRLGEYFDAFLISFTDRVCRSEENHQRLLVDLRELFQFLKEIPPLKEKTDVGNKRKKPIIELMEGLKNFTNEFSELYFTEELDPDLKSVIPKESPMLDIWKDFTDLKIVKEFLGI